MELPVQISLKTLCNQRSVGAYRQTDGPHEVNRRSLLILESNVKCTLVQELRLYRTYGPEGEHRYSSTLS